LIRFLPPNSVQVVAHILAVPPFRLSTLDPRLPQTGGEFQIRLARTQVPNRPRLAAAGKTGGQFLGRQRPQFQFMSEFAKTLREVERNLL